MNEEESHLSPSGEIWWEVGGTAKRIAAYLWFNVKVGETFTMAEVRKATHTEQQTQSDRRLRELRVQGWGITSYKDDGALSMNTYCLEKRGQRLWLGDRIERDVLSNKLRRQILDRDNSTCVVCGVAAGDEYSDLPGTKARMTIGHRVPNQRLGEATLDNLQLECSRCNETIRNLLNDPETLEDIIPSIRVLSREQLTQLQRWLANGRREQTDVDIVYARARRLNPQGYSRLLEYLAQIFADISTKN